MKTYNIQQVGFILEHEKLKLLADTPDIANFPMLPELLDYYISLVALAFHSRESGG